jgi:hypothetical protein
MKHTLIGAFLFLASCKSTESINRFAKSATSGVTEIDRGSFGFGKFCKFYDPAALKELTDTSLYAGSSHSASNCKMYKTSDSLLGIINQTLSNYFSLLQAVSDKKLIAYNARPLVSSLADIQSSLVPGLSFSDEKITATKGILNTLLNEPLKFYREKKLHKIMEENDSALGTVLLGYEFILDSALQGELDQAVQNYISFVYARLFAWSDSPVEKAFVNSRYQEFLGQMEDERLKLRKSVRMLETIRKGHHLLAFGEKKPGFVETETEIAEDILQINKLIEDIIKLTK